MHKEACMEYRIKLLFCMNASIHGKQFCMALNSYKDKTNYRTKYIEIKIK